MEKKKICLVSCSAPLYREAIFKLLDKELDCHFILASSSLQQMDTTQLRSVERIKSKKIKGRVSWEPDVLKATKAYDHVIMDLGIFSVTEWLVLLRAKFNRQKTYVWTHGWYGKETAVKKIVKRIYFSMIDGILLYGNYAKDLMIKEGYNPNKLFVIHNSLNHSRQVELRNEGLFSTIYKEHFGNDNPTLIFIGRLTPVKKLDMLLEAMSILKTSGKNYNLVFVGDGSERQSLDARTESLDLEDNVWFYGACYDEKTNAELIYNAELCVAPGNIGLTAMHTLVFGTPALSHDNSAYQMPEFESIIPGKTGDFFKQGDINSLAATIQNWFEAHTDREAIRQACYKEIDENWTPEFELGVIKEALENA